MRGGLREQPVQVGVRWARDVQITMANFVQSLVVRHHCDIHALKQRTRAQNGVVRLSDCLCDPS